MSIDPTKLKVAELKEQLISRGLDSKGLKAALVQRLQDAIDIESPTNAGESNFVESSTDNGNLDPNDESSLLEESHQLEKSQDGENISNTDNLGLDEDVLNEEAVGSNDNVSNVDNVGSNNNTSNGDTSSSNDNLSNTDNVASRDVSNNNSMVSSTGHVGDVQSNDNAVHDELVTEGEINTQVKTESSEMHFETTEVDLSSKADTVVEVKLEPDSETVTENLEGGDTNQLVTTEESDKLENLKSEVETEAVSESGDKVGGKRSPSPDNRDVKKANIKKETDEPDFDESSVLLDFYNSDLNLVIDRDTLLSAKPLANEGFKYMWAGARTTWGFTDGRYCFEVKITAHTAAKDMDQEQNPFVTRVGWSVNKSGLQLGEEPESFGYGGTAKFSSDLKFKNYGCKFDVGDVVGAYIDTGEDSVKLYYTVNGVFQGEACSVDRGQISGALFPHVLTKNCEFEVNMGQLENPWFSHPLELSDYVFCSNAPNQYRVRGSVGPKNKSECQVIMMVGLPGCGKTTWIEEYVKQNPDKQYNVIGTNGLIDRMRLMGLPRKRNYHGRWDQLIATCTRCLNILVEIANKRRRNFIIDQTNVYQSAQRRKLRNFTLFHRKAVVIVPKDDEYQRRVKKATTVDGKEVPRNAIMQMKSAFKLPEVGEYLDEVEFIEEQRESAQALVDNYNKEARAAGFSPPWEQQQRRADKKAASQQRFAVARGRGGSGGNWKNRRGGGPKNYHSNDAAGGRSGSWSSDNDRRSGGSGWWSSGNAAVNTFNGRGLYQQPQQIQQLQPWASGSHPQQRWGAQYGAYGYPQQQQQQQQQQQPGYNQYGGANNFGQQQQQMSMTGWGQQRSYVRPGQYGNYNYNQSGNRGNWGQRR